MPSVALPSLRRAARCRRSRLLIRRSGTTLSGGFSTGWRNRTTTFLCRCSVRPNRHKPGEKFVTEYRDQPMGGHGFHDWWYACRERAATRPASVLDHTRGNLKATQSCSATRQSPRPPTSTWTGISTSWRRRYGRCRRATGDAGERVVNRSRQQPSNPWSEAVYAPGRNRTCDLALRRRTLYPLSYRRDAVSVAPPPVRSEYPPEPGLDRSLGFGR
jgi:hypothetical protein